MYRVPYIQAQNLDVVHVYVGHWNTFLVEVFRSNFNLGSSVYYNRNFVPLSSFRQASTLRSKTGSGTCMSQYGTRGMVSPQLLYRWCVCTVQYRADTLKVRDFGYLRFHVCSRTELRVGSKRRADTFLAFSFLRVNWLIVKTTSRIQLFSYATTFTVYHRTLELLRRTHFHPSFAPSSALRFHRLHVTLSTVQEGILRTKQTAFRFL